MRKYLLLFNVKGGGRFPFQLLWRDECFPASGIAVAYITSSDPVARTVQLKSFRQEPTEEPDLGSWDLAGWPVQTFNHIRL